MSEAPKLYTQEIVVLASRLSKVDLTDPINIYLDNVGNIAVSDGNHRCFKAYQEGTLTELPKNKIGNLTKDVSTDPYYRPISELKIINDL